MDVIGVLTSPWAIIPDHLEELTRIYSAHLKGERADIEALEARAAKPLANRPQGYSVYNGVAVIPIDGVIAKKMNLFSQISGGVSTQLIERDFRQAMADDDVHSIILHTDTPGGAVDGTAELAKTIFEARGTKPIITLADGLMASAGVWIGSAADSIYMTSETTAVGSIGVVTQHVDYSEQNKQRGLTITDIYSGKYKRIAGENQPLSEEGHEYLQEHLDHIYSIFVDSVARHRGATVDDVLENMADGRLFIGQHAINAGLVDGFATLEELIGELTTLSDVATSIHASTAQASLPVAQPPDIFEQLPEDLAEAYAAGLTAGATQERERVLSIRQLSYPGHEALIEEFMFDGKTSQGEAAMAVLAAEKEVRATRARVRAADASELDEVSASVETDRQRVADAETAEARIRINWKANADLRADFGQNFERYKAYMDNRKRVVDDDDKKIVLVH